MPGSSATNFLVNVHVSWCVHVRTVFGEMLELVLAQPSRDTVLVGWFSLWRGANSDRARATLPALCACQIALVGAQCEF